MKRTTLKRKTPIRRARFRHLDKRPEPKHGANIIAVMQNMNDAAPAAADRSRTYDLVEVPFSGGTRPLAYLAAASPEERAPKRRSKYARRPRDFEFMGWVKAQPCLMMPYGGCSGVVEADHAGLDRGVGMKAPDTTCVPLCTQHHHDRHNFTGPFKGWDRERMRAWRELAIKVTQDSARRAGFVVVP